MQVERRITHPEPFEGEEALDIALRPRILDEFVGQNKIKENLKVFIEAARQRDESLDHILLHGPPGLGKTTLAHIISNEMGTRIEVTTGPILERPYDLAGILTKLEDKNIFFIDEIHRMNKTVEEYLYPALEDFKIDIVMDKGVYAQTMKLNLKHFTMIGATTRIGLLTAPLRNRFGITLRFDYYPVDDLFKIINRSARILGIEIDESGAREIARRSRGTPRVANRLLRRVRDFAQVKGKKVIDREIADYSLGQLDVDQRGLDDMDKKIILTIIEKFKGGPVGLNSLSVAVSEDPQTIEEVYEPFLIMEGFIKRTPRGREATDLAYRHFEIKSHPSRSSLF